MRSIESTPDRRSPRDLLCAFSAAEKKGDPSPMHVILARDPGVSVYHWRFTGARALLRACMNNKMRIANW